MINEEGSSCDFDSVKVIGTVAPKAISGVEDKASRTERLQKDHILALMPVCRVIGFRSVLLGKFSNLELCLGLYIFTFLAVIMAATISGTGICRVVQNGVQSL